MSRIKIIVIILCLTLFLACANQGQTPQPGLLVLTNVTVIDVTGAAPPARGMTVVIEGERIKEVGESAKVRVPRVARVVNASGKYLIPGLWDMHVHLSWTKATALPVLVANGVTSVRDLGGDYTIAPQLKREVAEGLRLGPRIKTAGPILDAARNVERMKTEKTIEVAGRFMPKAELRKMLNGVEAAARRASKK